MSLKIEINRFKNKNKYPYIGEYCDSFSLVLFVAQNTGICIDPNSDGALEDNWDEIKFKPFNGKVTLSNN
jgi:hypothetical protein